MSRLDEIRERHAARLRTRAAKGDGSVQMSTLVDDDVAWLLTKVTEARDDAAHFEAEYDDAVADLVRVASMPTIQAIIAEFPLSDDGTGHVVDCGYVDDEVIGCQCVSLPGRIRAVITRALAPVTPDAEHAEAGESS